MSQDMMIELDDLHVRYATTHAVQGVSLGDGRGPGVYPLSHDDDGAGGPGRRAVPQWRDRFAQR